ncbi:MAG: ATP-binding protein [Clostridiales bacterium]|nr:ATP-binding protein [Clostridiales bacterium]
MGLTNTQYDEIMRGYQRCQNQARQELYEREQEAYRRIPELSALDAQIAAASTACARALLEDPEENASADDSDRPDDVWRGRVPPDKTEESVSLSSIDLLRAQIDEISVKKAQLLREAGFPDDYLKMRYRCPDCQDTGYIGQEKCHCFRQATIDLLYMQSNLRDNIRGENFSAFSLEYYPETMKDPATGLTAAELAARALRECQRFVREFDGAGTPKGFQAEDQARSSGENLFLSGDTGLGKTFLSHCVANALLASTHSVIYFSAFRLFDLLADSSFGRAEESETSELERYIFACDLLIIDDLGTELVNSFVASRLFLILNERILRRKSTMISTNLSLAAIAERYSERVLSRISSDYRMLRLIGDDIRIQKKLEARKMR